MGRWSFPSAAPVTAATTTLGYTQQDTNAGTQLLRPCPLPAVVLSLGSLLTAAALRLRRDICQVEQAVGAQQVEDRYGGLERRQTIGVANLHEE